MTELQGKESYDMGESSYSYNRSPTLLSRYIEMVDNTALLVFVVATRESQCAQASALCDSLPVVFAHVEKNAFNK